jgi:hypothetical protein
MSYVAKYFGMPLLAAGPQVLTAAADVQYYSCPAKFQVQRIMATITTALNSTGTTVINVFSRPTHGSVVGQVLLGTLNIPNTAVVGQCYYKLVADNVLGGSVFAGQEVVFTVATVATTAGAALLSFLADESPEVPLNEVNMIASS